MAYIISFFYVISFIFLCLTATTFFSLRKTKMYPPKKVLKNRMILYAFGALLCFLIAWSFRYF